MSEKQFAIKRSTDGDVALMDYLNLTFYINDEIISFIEKLIDENKQLKQQTKEHIEEWDNVSKFLVEKGIAKKFMEEYDE